MQLHETHLIDHASALDFILAGNSTFTILSKKTETRFTFKITNDKKNVNHYYVNLMNGSNNETDYIWLYDIYLDGGFPTLSHKKKWGLNNEQPSWIALKYVIEHLLLNIPMPNLEIWHEGRCCRCGRKLTVPESIQSGIGPECATRQSFSFYKEALKLSV